jgi:hypothetical protein
VFISEKEGGDKSAKETHARQTRPQKVSKPAIIQKLRGERGNPPTPDI